MDSSGEMLYGFVSVAYWFKLHTLLGFDHGRSTRSGLPKFRFAAYGDNQLALRFPDYYKTQRALLQHVIPGRRRRTLDLLRAWSLRSNIVSWRSHTDFMYYFWGICSVFFYVHNVVAPYDFRTVALSLSRDESLLISTSYQCCGNGSGAPNRRLRGFRN